MSLSVYKWGWFATAKSRAFWGWSGDGVTTATPITQLRAYYFNPAPIRNVVWN